MSERPVEEVRAEEARADEALADDEARGDDARGDDATPVATDDRPSPNGRTRAASAADVRLTGDRLVVRPPSDGERRTNAGLLIPATAAQAPKRLAWADVALVGPDVRVAKVGDRVLYLPQSGLEVELEGEDLVLLRERDVQAVSSPPSSATERTPGQYL